MKGKRRGKAFISRSQDARGGPRISLHQDGGSRGRKVSAGPSPRTVLGGTSTQEYPTIIAARREMLSWHFLHLEPTSLRTPDPIGERSPVDERGRHIAATLRRLGTVTEDPDHVLTEATNRLARFVAGVRRIRVREDEPERELAAVLPAGAS